MTKNSKKYAILSLSIVFIFVFSFLAMRLINTLMAMHKESYIRQEIEKAKYCGEDSDCVDAGGECPFGCYAYVNKNEVVRISHLIGSFDSKCVYGCISCPTAKCEDKKCKAVCDDGKLY